MISQAIYKGYKLQISSAEVATSFSIRSTIRKKIAFLEYMSDDKMFTIFKIKETIPEQDNHIVYSVLCCVSLILGWQIAISVESVHCQ